MTSPHDLDDDDSEQSLSMDILLEPSPPASPVASPKRSPAKNLQPLASPSQRGNRGRTRPRMKPSRSFSPLRRMLSGKAKTPLRLPSRGGRRGKMRMANEIQSERNLGKLKDDFKNLLDDSRELEGESQRIKSDDDNKDETATTPSVRRDHLYKRSYSNSKLTKNIMINRDDLEDSPKQPRKPNIKFKRKVERVKTMPEGVQKLDSDFKANAIENLNKKKGRMVRRTSSLTAVPRPRPQFDWNWSGKSSNDKNRKGGVLAPPAMKRSQTLAHYRKTTSSNQSTPDVSPETKNKSIRLFSSFLMPSPPHSPKKERLSPKAKKRAYKKLGTKFSEKYSKSLTNFSNSKSNLLVSTSLASVSNSKSNLLLPDITGNEEGATKEKPEPKKEWWRSRSPIRGSLRLSAPNWSPIRGSLRRSVTSPDALKRLSASFSHSEGMKTIPPRSKTSDAVLSKKKAKGKIKGQIVKGSERSSGDVWKYHWAGHQAKSEKEQQAIIKEDSASTSKIGSTQKKKSKDDRSAVTTDSTATRRKSASLSTFEDMKTTDAKTKKSKANWSAVTSGSTTTRRMSASLSIFENMKPNFIEKRSKSSDELMSRRAAKKMAKEQTGSDNSSIDVNEKYHWAAHHAPKSEKNKSSKNRDNNETTSEEDNKTQTPTNPDDALPATADIAKKKRQSTIRRASSDMAMYIESSARNATDMVKKAVKRRGGKKSKKKEKAKGKKDGGRKRSGSPKDKTKGADDGKKDDLSKKEEGESAEEIPESDLAPTGSNSDFLNNDTKKETTPPPEEAPGIKSAAEQYALAFNFDAAFKEKSENLMKVILAQSFGSGLAMPAVGDQNGGQADEQEDEGPSDPIVQKMMKMAAPSSFVCPISQGIMKDPVTIASTGSTYEKNAIQWWLTTNDTDPLTQQTIQGEDLVPNQDLKEAIADWKEDYQNEIMNSEAKESAPAAPADLVMKDSNAILTRTEQGESTDAIKDDTLLNSQQKESTENPVDGESATKVPVEVGLPSEADVEMEDIQDSDWEVPPAQENVQDSGWRPDAPLPPALVVVEEPEEPVELDDPMDGVIEAMLENLRRASTLGLEVKDLVESMEGGPGEEATVPSIPLVSAETSIQSKESTIEHIAKLGEESEPGYSGAATPSIPTITSEQPIGLASEPTSLLREESGPGYNWAATPSIPTITSEQPISMASEPTSLLREESGPGYDWTATPSIPTITSEQPIGVASEPTSLLRQESGPGYDWTAKFSGLAPAVVEPMEDTPAEVATDPSSPSVPTKTPEQRISIASEHISRRASEPGYNWTAKSSGLTPAVVEPMEETPASDWKVTSPKRKQAQAKANVDGVDGAAFWSDLANSQDILSEPVSKDSDIASKPKPKVTIHEPPKSPKKKTQKDIMKEMSQSTSALMDIMTWDAEDSDEEEVVSVSSESADDKKQTQGHRDQPKTRRKSYFDSDSDSDDSSSDSEDSNEMMKESSMSMSSLDSKEKKGPSPETSSRASLSIADLGSSSHLMASGDGDDEDTEAMQVDGFKSMPVMDAPGNQVRDLPNFRRNRQLSKSLNASMSALDYVQFTPSNFVQQREERFDNYYELGQLLGEGEFGEVFIGYPKQGSGLGEERAIKIIDKHRMCKGDYEQVINEFNLLKGLTHPNLLTLYGFYEDDSNCYIVTDLCKGGELWDELDVRGNFEEEDAAVFMTNLLSAVKFLQSHKIVHRDINLENILLEENKELDQMKIIDFGLATKYEDGVKLTELAGKVHYVAPEVLNMSYEGSKYDVWSCGVVAFILLSGYAPFEGDNDGLVMEQITLGLTDANFNDPAWDGISDEAKDFVRHLMTFEEDSRPTAEKALKHAWIQNSIKANSDTFMQSYGESSITCFENMQDFASDSALKLKQAVYVFIASQLLHKEEREEIDKVFRGMDDDRDGKLSKSDIKKGYKRFFDADLSDEETDRMFDRINTSQTGFIDYTEFVIAAIQKSKILDSGKLRAAFSSFDRGDKGFITSKDLKISLSGVIALPETNEDGLDADGIINEMMNQVDVEGDGRISYQNFEDMMMFSSLALDEEDPMEVSVSDSADDVLEPSAFDQASSLDYDFASAGFIGPGSTFDAKQASPFLAKVDSIPEE